MGAKIMIAGGHRGDATSSSGQGRTRIETLPRPAAIAKDPRRALKALASEGGRSRLPRAGGRGSGRARRERLGPKRAPKNYGRHPYLVISRVTPGAACNSQVIPAPFSRYPSRSVAERPERSRGTRAVSSRLEPSRAVSSGLERASRRAWWGPSMAALPLWEGETHYLSG